MARTPTNDLSTPPRQPWRLLEPFGAALSVAVLPGALTVGVLAGAWSGGLIGLAGALLFVRSPAGPVVAPLSALAILSVWPVATGAVALASTRHANGESGRAGPALRAAVRRALPLIGAALPVFALVAAVIVVQAAVFVLTRAPPAALGTDRPVALVALVFTLLFLIDALVVAGAAMTFWLLTPYVISEGRGAGSAYAAARDAFWRAPALAIGVLAGLLALASALTLALTGVVVVALMIASTTQLAGAGELVLLRFSEPLVQASFIIPTGDFVAIVVMATGIGAALGAAVGFGHAFGVAGGAGLHRATAPDGKGGLL